MTIFTSVDFKIEIITNLTEVNFLDVTFNLERNTYRQYKNQNDTLICIHIQHNMQHKSLTTSLMP